MLKTYLFTSSKCHKCPEAKQFVNDKKLEVEIVEADTSKEGTNLAIKYEVQQVPIFVIENIDGTVSKYSLADLKQKHNL